MGLIEDALRQTLAAAVATPPAVDDPASRAILRARRIRRRRTSLTAAAVVASLVLVGVGYAAVDPPPPAAPPALTGPDDGVWSAALPVDVLAANQITLATGVAISLSALPPAQRAWRVPGGWLVRTHDEVTATEAVFYVGQSGALVKLAEGKQVAVGRYGPGGAPMIAWGGDGSVSIAAFDGKGIGTAIRTEGVGGLRPWAVLGGGVLLAEQMPDAAASYDMWFPAQGPYVAGPRFTNEIVGVTADSRQLFAMVGVGKPCLALIDPSDFEMRRSQCDLGLKLDDRAFSSPDGRWLVTLSAMGVDLYDVSRVWTSSIPVANWQVTGSGLAWLADGSFIVIDENRVVRLRPDKPGREEVAQVGVPRAWQVTGIDDLRD